MNRNPLHVINRIYLKIKVHKVRKAVLPVFLVYSIVYFIFSMLAPAKEIRSITRLYGSEMDEKWNLAGVNKMADSLLERSAVLNSRLVLSEKDSIGMFINLHDSLLCLEFQGVTIHWSAISSIGLSRFFSRLDNATLYQYLSNPFMIEGYRSTIIKVPVVIKHAPKDTSEANKTGSVPQLPPENYARFSFNLDNSLIIIIEQEERPSGKQKLTSISYKCRDKLRLFAETSSSILRLSVPVYHPYIRLKIPREEARTIFRALPEHAFIGLEL